MLNHTLSVVHLTSAHNRNDTRIFLKECRSLTKEYSVSMVVADGKGFEHIQGVDIHDVGLLSGRLNRIFKTARKVYEKALALNADLYHLHDPELIPIGLKLKKHGKRVIFDAHEDLPKQILAKPYLNRFSARILAFIIKHYENWACAKFDGVISATPIINQKYLKINRHCIDINNYPILGELGEDKNWNQVQDLVCFIGDISRIRGMSPLIKAFESIQSDTRLALAGSFVEPDLKIEMATSVAWKKVDDLGYLNRLEVKALFSKSFAGVVTFLPVPNHIDSQPNKMFEYMSAGLPVVGSHFPLWRDILEGNNCGICVDPSNSAAIAHAIDELANDKEKARKMGMNGKNAVLTKFNWNIEEKKLQEFYKKVLQS